MNSISKKIITGIAIAAGHTFIESMRVACYRTAIKSEQMQNLKQSKTYKAIGDALTIGKNIIDTAIGGYIIYKAIFK